MTHKAFSFGDDLDRKVTDGFILPGKINMIVDGQFGSTGKGLIAQRIATDNFIDIVCSNLSPNAGHTFYLEGEKKIAKQLPVAGLLGDDDRRQIYLTAGSIIEPQSLLNEMEAFGIDENQVVIHPNAAIVEAEHIDAERRRNSSVTKISSTQSGSGYALASKIMRRGNVASNCDALRSMVRKFDLAACMREGLSVLMETSQGVGLGVNSGFAYPYCTAREITPAQFLSDAGCHPDYLGNTIMTLRTYPIRVGNIVDVDGTVLGESGPFWPDSREVDWKSLGFAAEQTTVTKRERRIATFSWQQLRDSFEKCRPTHIFLNFVNYLADEDVAAMKELAKFLQQRKIPLIIGFGPDMDDLYLYESHMMGLGPVIGDDKRSLEGGQREYRIASPPKDYFRLFPQ